MQAYTAYSTIPVCCYREPEKRRYTVTDDDLLSDLVAAAAGGDADR